MADFDLLLLLECCGLGLAAAIVVLLSICGLARIVRWVRDRRRWSTRDEQAYRELVVDFRLHQARLRMDDEIARQREASDFDRIRRNLWEDQ